MAHFTCFRRRVRRLTSGLLLGFFTGVAALSVIAAPTGGVRQPATLLWGMPHAVMIVAHRGDWRNHPENSLPAIEACIAHGWEMAEIDLQRTRDGAFILMHDATVDRTTTGTGQVKDLDLARIRELRLRDVNGAATPLAVPTLREALLLSRGRILLNLDKSSPYLRELLPLLHETGTTGHVVLKGKTTVDEFLATHGDLMTTVAYMPMIDFRVPGASQIAQGWLEKAKPCAMEMIFREWNAEVAEVFARCRELGVRIWVNVLSPEISGGLSDDLALADPAKVYGVLLDRGVTLFQTDRPRELQAYLRERSPPATRASPCAVASRPGSVSTSSGRSHAQPGPE
jgi:glycerophosphoryl diester phosphodiesterase